MPESAGATQAGQRLTPQQQHGYDLIVRQAMGFLMDPRRARHIVAKARAGDPRQAVVDAVAPLLQKIYESAQAAGAQVDMVTLLAAGIAVIANLAEMLAVAGIIAEQDVPAFARDAAQLAVQQHNTQAPGPGPALVAQGPGAGMGVAPNMDAGATASVDPMLRGL